MQYPDICYILFNLFFGAFPHSVTQVYSAKITQMDLQKINFFIYIYCLHSAGFSSSSLGVADRMFSGSVIMIIIIIGTNLFERINHLYTALMEGASERASAR
jgi:hypothetical protein